MKKKCPCFHPDDKMAIFIDGANLYATSKALEFDIDYSKLMKWATSIGRLVRIFYYTALIEDQEYSPLRPLVDWLDYNGYSLVTKTAKEYTDSYGRKRIKGNMDIELAIDMIEMADHVDHIILFSGDGDFKRLVETIQKKGVKVTVISTLKTDTPMVSDELRRQTDCFFDLCDLEDVICRSNNNHMDNELKAHLEEEASFA